MKRFQNKEKSDKPGTVIIHGVHLGKTQVMTKTSFPNNSETDNQPTKILHQREIDPKVPKTVLRPEAVLTSGPQNNDSKPLPTVVLGFGRKSVPATTVPQQEWPQGWLVAIEGPMKGRTFPISYGYNHIGRAESNRICISDDPGVSSVQCVVHYDSDKRIFFIEKAAQSSQETRRSDGSLIDGGIVPLEAGEIILLSPQTKLRFMPFCGDYFNWDYEN